MSIHSNLKRLIVVAGLALSFPLVALADAPPPPGAEHAVGWNPHEHGMAGCPMMPPGMFHGGEDFGEGGPLPPFLSRLRLTEAQQDRIFEIMHAQAPQARDQAKALRKAHEGLHELAHAANYDDAKAKALADALAKAVAESALLHVRIHHQVYEMLTPEQRQALGRHAGHGDGDGHGEWHHDEHPEVHPQ